MKWELPWRYPEWLYIAMAIAFMIGWYLGGTK